MTDRILITSALPYIEPKHIGNLCGSLLPADVLARYHRSRGRDTLFICGTDEHGTPAELAAIKSGRPVAAHCDTQHLLQAETYARFGLSFDHFSRTSSLENHRLTQSIFVALDRRGFIEARAVPQVWSRSDGRFLPDRYVIGTCPHCGFAAARGDQCDGCGRLLDPASLLDPRSSLSGSKDVEFRLERHLFLRQSALADRLREWVDGDGEWEPLARSIALKWLDEGVEDRCITRALDWGVPVPKEGFEHLKLYCWFDAPIGYLAAVREWCTEHGRDWLDWIGNGPDRRWIQVIGKDNVPFHAISFPATVLGSGEDIRLPDRIKALNWLTFGGAKFSTSFKRGVFCDEALELFPADAWRWWLTANSPEPNDVDFSFSRFAAGVNTDLADNLGNLANRILSFASSRFDGAVPVGGEQGPAEATLAIGVGEALARATEALEDCRQRRYCEAVRSLWSAANAYVANEAPWTVLKSDPARAACITRTALGALATGARVAAPIIPSISGRLLSWLGEPPSTTWPTELVVLDAGRPIHVDGVLFPRITATEASGLDELFRGRALDAACVQV